MARAVAAVSLVADPDLVVLGGGIGSAPGFAEAVAAELRRLLSPAPDVRVSAMGGEATVEGGLRLGIDRAWQRVLDRGRPPTARWAVMPQLRGDAVSLSVRRYQAGDEAAVYDVCVRTGDDGQDATGKFDDAAAAGGHLCRALPLPGARPGLCPGRRAAAGGLRGRDGRHGRLRRVVPPRVAPPVRLRRARGRRRPPATRRRRPAGRFYQPERMLGPALSDYPAHLHIDVLPAYQGGGHGRRLIETFVAAAGARPVPAACTSPCRPPTPAPMAFT